MVLSACVIAILWKVESPESLVASNISSRFIILSIITGHTQSLDLLGFHDCMIPASGIKRVESDFAAFIITSL